MNESEAVPPKTPSTSQARFVSGDEDTVIDLKRKLVWTRQDTWQMTGQWMNWVQSRDYALELNKKSFAGFKDWRLASTEEAKSLFDKKQDNKDHMGQNAHLQGIFPEGYGFLCWTKDTRTKIQAVRFNFRKGGILYDDVYRTSRGAARFCREMKR